eukprot:956327_1
MDDSGALMHMKHLWRYLCDLGRDDLLVSTWSVLNTEEFDSDSLLHYVTHTKDRNQSPIATALEEDYSVFVEFFDSLLVSDRSFSCFSIGYRFYYWPYYQNLLHEEEYVHNRNHHSGYKPHQLYVHAKYSNIKEELLSKVISFDTAAFTNLMQKAVAIASTKEARSLKAERNQLLHYCIAHGSQISLNHLVSIILYCDYSALCTAFSASFRRLQPYERIEVTIRRNAEYAN